MEFSIRVLVVAVVALIVAAIIIFTMATWAQGSEAVSGSFFDWIKNIIGGPLGATGEGRPGGSEGGTGAPSIPGVSPG